MLTKRTLIITGSILAALLLGFIIYKISRGDSAVEMLATVKKGPYKVEIETTGELEAKNSVKILGPSSLRDFRIWNVTIQNIIDEGTVVKKGDWVASLDRSEFQNRFEEKKISLDKEQAEFTQTQLDTTLQLREARDQLINLHYAVEEKQIIYDQSQFEPPATIKQAQINVERAKRELTQATENYKIKKRQNAEKMREQNAELRSVQNEFNSMETVSQGFTIMAPEDGMVIYTKGWDNKPVKSGSQINMWDPTVATLPDLTKMMSKTYVNEVDVRKIKAGQTVEIGLDAYPDKKLSGKVTKVANVGEQRPNSDAKVFQVDIEINGTDPALRPAMTTSNKILVSKLDDALSIPLECLHSFADSITYVYLKSGMQSSKQEVTIGKTNANDAVILAGLQEGDQVYLSIPSSADGEIDLLPELNGKRQKQKEEEAETPSAIEKTMLLKGDSLSADSTRVKTDDDTKSETKRGNKGARKKQAGKPTR